VTKFHNVDLTVERIDIVTQIALLPNLNAHIHSLWSKTITLNICLPFCGSENMFEITYKQLLFTQKSTMPF